MSKVCQYIKLCPKHVHYARLCSIMLMFNCLPLCSKLCQNNSLRPSAWWVMALEHNCGPFVSPLYHSMPVVFELGWLPSVANSICIIILNFVGQSSAIQKWAAGNQTSAEPLSRPVDEAFPGVIIVLWTLAHQRRLDTFSAYMTMHWK